MKNEHFDGHWWAEAILDWQKRTRAHDSKPLTADGKLTELGRSWVHMRIIDRHKHYENLEIESVKHLLKTKEAIESANMEHTRVHSDASTTPEAQDWARRVLDTAEIMHKSALTQYGVHVENRQHLESLGGPAVLHDDFCSMIEQEIAEIG